MIQNLDATYTGHASDCTFSGQLMAVCIALTPGRVFLLILLGWQSATAITDIHFYWRLSLYRVAWRIYYFYHFPSVAIAVAVHILKIAEDNYDFWTSVIGNKPLYIEMNKFFEYSYSSET